MQELEALGRERDDKLLALAPLYNFKGDKVEAPKGAASMSKASNVRTSIENQVLPPFRSNAAPALIGPRYFECASVPPIGVFSDFEESSAPSLVLVMIKYCIGCTAASNLRLLRICTLPSLRTYP